MDNNKVIDFESFTKLAQRVKHYVDKYMQDKQNISDETLETESKNIIGAINELNYVVKNYQPPDDFEGTVDSDALDDLINDTFNNNE